MKKGLKALKINTQFVAKAVDDSDELYIEGYASTSDIDRANDVISRAAWEAGITNYLKNPIILAYHDHTKPVGRAVEIKPDSKGLWIKARISKALKEVYDAVKDGLITAFSVSFIPKDGEYDSMADVLIFTELELLEISVVSVPCNQNALFNLSKAFDNEDDYKSYRELFSTSGALPKKAETLAADSDTVPTFKEIKMDEETQKLIDAAVKAATEKALAEHEAKQKALEEEAAAKAAAEAALEAKIAEAVAKATAKPAEGKVETGESGAEKLYKELEKRFEEQNGKVSDLMAEIKDKSDEIHSLTKGKMRFSDTDKDGISKADKDAAVFTAKIMGKSINELDFVNKLGDHFDSGATGEWETEVSTNMEHDIRDRLVVAPLFREVQMNAAQMVFPINPDAGSGEWITSGSLGTTASTGSTSVTNHEIHDATLVAYKVAAKDYMNFEEEEDAIIPLIPLVREALVRRIANSVDKAYLVGTATSSPTYDPIKGICQYGASKYAAIGAATSGDGWEKVTVTHLAETRKQLGYLGLEPSNVTYLVSPGVYYDLLDDTNFKTVDKVGDRATILKGQIGIYAGSPVIVSNNFNAVPTDTTGGTGTNYDASLKNNFAACAVYTGYFLSGVLRQTRLDRDDMVEAQKIVLVATRRCGIINTSSTSTGVATLRWIHDFSS